MPEVSLRQQLEALREENLRLQSLLDSLPAFYFLIDGQDHLVDYHAHRQQDLHIAPEHFLGKHIAAVLPADVAKRMERMCQEVRHSGDSQSMAYSLPLPEGDRWFLATLSPSFENHIVCLSQDITKSKKTEQALRDSERFLNSIFDSIQDGISVLDTKMRILRVNRKMQEWYSHMTPLEGRICYEVYHGRDSICEVCPTRRALRTGQLECNEVPLVQEGKVTGTIELFAFPMRSSEGEIVGVVEYVRDITSRKAIEQERSDLLAQMLHAQKLEALGVLAGGIAHDFNNILMGVLGYADLALMKLDPQSPAVSDIEQISTSALRAAELAGQMLAYSGKGRFLVQSLNLNELVDEIDQMLRTVVTKSAELRFDLSPKLPAVEANTAQVRQVIMNLITNASDAIGSEPGVIRVSTGTMHADRAYLATTCFDEELPEGPYAYVEVTDTGVGMDRQTLDKVFDPFFSTKIAGRGLGLASVMGIMRGHKGTVTVDSEPGRGTTFRVLFPCSQEVSSARIVPPSTKAPAKEWRATGTVLVVDDESHIREMLCAVLEAHNSKVLEARDGLEMLEVVRQNPTDISAVILDLTMPRMGGEEAFREIRKLYPDLPLILMSGYSKWDAAQVTGEDGKMAFLQKPFTKSALIAALQSLLEPDD